MTTVILARFPVESAAYQVFSEVKNVAGIESAAVVARDANGTIRVPEFAGSGGDSSGFWTGSLIGALVGVLGGPLGMLLGWTTGALVGSTVDLSGAASEAADDNDSIALLAQNIDPDSNVLIVDAADSATSTVDSLVEAADGVTTHIPADVVQDDVENARKAAAEAARAARKERAQERRADFETKVRDFFHRH